MNAVERGAAWLEPSTCVGSSQGIEADHPRIRAVAAELTGSAPSAVEKARVLFEYVRDRWKYSYRVRLRGPEDISARVMLDRDDGFCIQKAALLAALARAAGVPTALCFQTIRDRTLPRERIEEFFPEGLMVGHGLVAFHLGGRWVRQDPTHDRRTAERLGCDVVEFSPERDQLLPERSRSGHPLIEIVDDHGLYAQVCDWAIAHCLTWPWQTKFEDWCALIREVASGRPA